MKSQKIEIDVIETIRHKVVLTMDKSEADDLIDDMSMSPEMAGDFCSSATIKNAQWEVEDYTVTDIESSR